MIPISVGMRGWRDERFLWISRGFSASAKTEEGCRGELVLKKRYIIMAGVKIDKKYIGIRRIREEYESKRII